MNLLGIDIGTTSIKACLFNESGILLQSETFSYELTVSGDFVEFNPEEYYNLCTKAINLIKENHKIDAMAIDTQCETLILTDENGAPLCNSVVWLDNRAINEAKEIENYFGREKIYSITGQPQVTATWPACKLLWFKKNRPELFSKVRKVFLLEDYILFKLTGKFVTEKTLQSSSLYFDIRNACWWDDMLDYLGIKKDYLPILYDSGKTIGKYSEIIVVSGAMDQVAGAIGAGTIHNNSLSEMTGTTMVLFAPKDVIPKFNPDSIVPCHYNYNGKYCLISWTPTAGIALKWFKDTLCENISFKEMDDLAKKIPSGSGGLTFLPYLCGSTIPKYNPSVKGCFYGMTLEHTRGHFIRSILESVACMLKENMDYLNIKSTAICSIGGGASSPLWCQIKADMTGCKITTLENKETACLGSAILAGVGAGIFESVETACKKFVRVKAEYMPNDNGNNAVYENYKHLDKIINK